MLTTQTPTQISEQTPTQYQEVFRIASTLYQQKPDWVTFFREVLGIEGVVRKAFTELEDLTAFEQSKEFEGIQHMLGKLRKKSATSSNDQEPTRVITVRMPKSLHESLRTEAHDHQISMNKLCISKLLQIIEESVASAEA